MSFLKSLLRFLGLVATQLVLTGALFLLFRRWLGEGETPLADFTGAFIVGAVLLTLVALVRPTLFAVFLGQRAQRWRLLLWFAATVTAVIMMMLSYEGKLYALYGATFYEGPRPEPQSIKIPDVDGAGTEVWAYPGQVLLTTVPGTTMLSSRGVIESRGGRMLARLPTLNTYLVGVEPGREAEFIKSAESDPQVALASPNLVLEPAEAEPVVLTKEGRNMRGLVALLGSAAPSQRVVMIQLDDFIEPHGKNVRQVGLGLAKGQDPMSVHVGQLPCGPGFAALCSSSDESLSGLAAALAGAELNNQKVVINLSWAAKPPRTENALRLEDGSGVNANAWARSAYEAYYRQVAAVLAASEWAQRGNVVVSVSSGNGALLIDEHKENEKEEQILKNGAVDVNPALERLRASFPEVMKKNLVFCGAVQTNGRLAKYSNFGDGVIYAPVSDALPGTSFAAPQCWAASFNAWQNDPSRPSGDVVTALQGSAAKNKNGWPILNPDDAIAVFRGEKEPIKQAAPAPKLTTGGKVSPQPTPAPAEPQGTLCNGKRFSDCDAGQNFYCPPEGGNASCIPNNYKLCQGKWWAPCSNSTDEFICGSGGAECRSQEPTPIAAPPIPESGPVTPQHSSCLRINDCQSYSTRHCQDVALCSPAGTCHCVLPNPPSWEHCPCPSGYTCIGLYCAVTEGGWPNE